MVDPGNADFAQARIENAPLEIDLIEGMDHFVPWSHPHLIRHAIIELIDGEIQPGIISGN
ncbi:MAG: hypothetical protein HC859_13370 [Bacteroidia bacterium]|nr:hypothetical protein [Bacteroidia bacterium]